MLTYDRNSNNVRTLELKCLRFQISLNWWPKGSMFRPHWGRVNCVDYERWGLQGFIFDAGYLSLQFWRQLSEN